MKTRIPFLLAAVLTTGFIVHSIPLAAAEKVALVVGNNTYANAASLKNAVNDSEAISDLLVGLGFEVIALENATIDEFYEGLDRFSREAASARVGLFYFAGHGVEVEGRNYLIPVDAALERQSQLRTQVVSVDVILNEMKSVKLPAKMLILDCCRDNPLTRSWLTTRSTQKGLASIQDQSLPEATMILFAAAPGQAALDGTGTNSPFTKALINELGKKGRNALDSFYAVSDSVVQETGSRQEPWVKVDGAGRTFRQFSLAPGEVETTNSPEPASSQPMTKQSSQTASNSPGGVRVVPDQYGSIQEAIDAAQAGEVIFIKNGIYSEFIEVNQKERVEIRGESRSGTIVRMPFEAEWGSILAKVWESENCSITNLTLEFPPGGLSTKRPSTINGVNCLVCVQADGFQLIDCTLQGGNEISGVAFYPCSARVSGCSIAKCNPYGIAASGSSVELLNNTLSDCTVVGISIEKQSNGTVSGNTIERCGKKAIMVADKGSTATVSGNHCLKNEEVGIMFGAGAGGLAEKNRCEKNLVGILVLDPGTNPEIRLNQCLENLNGIEVYGGSSPLIAHNECHRNQGSGIFAYGAKTKPSIVSNFCSNNGNMGIGVEAATYPARFEGNVAENNAGADIERQARAN